MGEKKQNHITSAWLAPARQSQLSLFQHLSRLTSQQSVKPEKAQQHPPMLEICIIFRSVVLD